ncbi:MAG: DUF748 domain-containing protein, partial [Tagaea sp.]
MGLPPALWWGPSALLRFALTRGLESQGVRVAALDQAVFSLTQGRIDLRKLDVQPPLGPPVTVARIDLEFSWRALLAGRVEIAELTISGFELRLEKSRDGAWRLPLSEGTAAPAAAPAEPFALGIARLVASDGRVTLADGARSLAIGVERFDVSGFDLRRPGQALRVDLAATLAGGRVRASGEVTPLAETPEAAATLRAAGVDIGALAPFFGIEFAGALDGEVSVRANAASVELRGQADLARLRAPGVAAEALAWRGHANWAPALPLEIEGTAAARGLAAAPLHADAARFDGRVRIGAEMAFEGTASFDGPAYEASGARIAARHLAANALRATWRDPDWTLATDAAADGVAVAIPAGEIAFDTLKAPGLRARMQGDRGRLETPVEIGVASFAGADLRARLEALRGTGLALDFGRESGLAGGFASGRAEFAAGDARANFDALELDLRRLAWTPDLAAEFRVSAAGAAFAAPELSVRAQRAGVDGRWTGTRFDGQISAEGAGADLAAARIAARAAR